MQRTGSDEPSQGHLSLDDPLFAHSPVGLTGQTNRGKKIFSIILYRYLVADCASEN